MRHLRRAAIPLELRGLVALQKIGDVISTQSHVFKEPGCVIRRVRDHIRFERAEACPPVVVDLRWIRRNVPVVDATEHMDILVLDQRPHLRPVLDQKQRTQGHREPHLVLQAPGCSDDRLLTGPRVTATGVGPEPAGMILPTMALLKKKLTGAICDEHRNRPVLAPVDVRLKLRGRADVIAVGVDENDAFIFINHGSKPFLCNRQPGLM